MSLSCLLLARPGSMDGAEIDLHSLQACLGMRCNISDFGEPREDLRDIDIALMHVDPAGLQSALLYCAAAQNDVPECAVFVLAQNLNESALTQLVAAGAADFVDACASPDEFGTRLRRLIGTVAPAPKVHVRALMDERLKDFIGNCSVFTREITKLPTIAGCDSGVLILGETGTGKEVCARAIHYLSARASKPWVAVNCGAIPADLIESELFGHVKGAYTNASTTRAGLVREAEGGTLFLDEIDALPLAAQSKLLRFLQEREYRALGSNTVLRANVRVMAASNGNLQELIARGQFRQDLYFRLNVLNVTLPALRDRREDIPVLALYFVRQFAMRFKRPVNGLTPRGLQKLLACDWPGNVRELQHVIERAVLLAEGRALGPEDINLNETGGVTNGVESLRVAKARVVQNFERAYIEQVLAFHAGNVTHAAKAAQKNRRAFFELMRKYHIDPTHYRADV
ncbi:MAG TPA: sigma-54 dependent transcriptional regulator [Burkholderiales bacterium]|nr:sigma-54 dependent transcriptional regulator [Burkholderiales bacterium]